MYGIFVTKFNLQVAAFRRKYLTSYPITEAVTLATLTAMIQNCWKVPDLEPLRRVLRGCGWDPDIVTAKEVKYLGQQLIHPSGEGWKLRVLKWRDVVSSAW